ncbi:MAG TPA: alpha/beta hydrolase [Gemmatimonadaceae bacterium]|jgi:acetyl esterase/lipase|nr:alpha/beta hydrolase [Gemmatimonadaceae bacterium]
MPLDRHAKRLLDMISAGRGERAVEITAESLRLSMIRFAGAADARNEPIGHVEDRQVHGPDGAILIRVFTPADAGTEALPCILYFHGGTGIFCSIDTHDGLCRMLANSSGARVVSVEYRLAPEHPFPAAIDDGAFIMRWVAEHAADLGVDSRRLVVAGDSAGGTIAAVICQIAARDHGPRPALQVLLCPVTDLASESESRRELADGYFIERSTLEWAKSVYSAGAELRDPRISPLRAASFAGLPPAHIHTAEFDPMRDEGQAYADALTADGVSVRYTCHPGLIHHFYCMAGAIPKARAVVSSIGAEIRAALGGAA